MAASRVSYKTATIALGASLSGAVDLEGRLPCAIVCPAELDGTSLTFQGSADGTNFFNVYAQDGNEYTVTVAASRYVILLADYFAGMRAIKVRAGTSGAPTDQTTTATNLVLAARNM